MLICSLLFFYEGPEGFQLVGPVHLKTMSKPCNIIFFNNKLFLTKSPPKFLLDHSRFKNIGPTHSWCLFVCDQLPKFFVKHELIERLKNEENSAPNRLFFVRNFEHKSISTFGEKRKTISAPWWNIVCGSEKDRTTCAPLPMKLVHFTYLPLIWLT